MIKIIKQGHRKQITTFTCAVCGTVFEFEIEDLKHQDSDGIYPASDYIDCPMCARMIPVNVDKEFPWEYSDN